MNQTRGAVAPEVGFAITQVLAQYAHVMDRRAARSLPDVFTDDGVFDLANLGGPVYRGLADLEQFLARDDEVHPPFHAMTATWVYERDGTMCSLSKWVTADRDTGLPRSGDYLDEWRGTPRGWRIAERVVLPRWWGGPWAAGYSAAIDPRLRETPWCERGDA